MKREIENCKMKNANCKLQNSKGERQILKIFFIFCSLTMTQFLFATITYSPTQPNVEQSITFTVTHPDGVYPAGVQWNFGDGTSVTGSTTVTKKYYKTGTFTVSVSYRTLKQQSVNEQTTINVSERRRITFSPLYPAVGKPLTLRAENFLSNQILWNFGDGTPPQCSSTIITHTYKKTGRYTVTARDWCGKSEFTISQSVNITEGTGPRAPFQIYFIQLRFEDGKPYKVVPKDEKLIAYADIKYEGTGILQAQWLVDGVPFKPLSTVLPFAKETVINSGEIPGLPTQFPGLHEVTLRIIQPQTEYQIPVLRYFVSLERVEKEAKKEIVSISSLEISDLKGNKISLNSDSIKAPSNEHIILRGKIKADEERIPFALLRVYLGNELIDQQIIKELRPGEEREVITSILNSFSEASKIYLLLYNISQKPPQLIFLRKVDIIY